MFIIEVRGERHLWNNEPGDDFLQFLPGYFDCEPSEIKVSAITDRREIRKIRQHLASPTGVLLLGEDHALHVGEQVIEDGVVLEVGDKDPDGKKNAKIKEGDPRTVPHKVKKTEVLRSLPTQELVEWPYESAPDGRLRFKGNKFRAP